MPNSLSDFTQRAIDYDLSRPRYYEILNLISNALNKDQFGIVVDVGAGTGQLSETFLEQEVISHMYSVEPCVDMFNIMKNKSKIFNNWTAYNCPAENINLPNNSVNLICCAQSFHFFNNEFFKNEVNRILAPGGRIVLIWGVIDDNDSMVKNFHNVLLSYSNDNKSINSVPNFIDQENLYSFFNPLSFIELKQTIYLSFTLERLISLVFSFSYMPTRNDSTAKALINDIKSFFVTNHNDEQVQLKFDYYIYLSDSY